MDNITVHVGNEELIHGLLDIITNECTILMSSSAVTSEVIEQSGPEYEMIYYLVFEGGGGSGEATECNG